MRPTLLSILFLSSCALGAPKPQKAATETVRHLVDGHGKPIRDYKPFQEACEHEDTLACGVWADGLRRTRLAGKETPQTALTAARAAALRESCQNAGGWPCLFGAPVVESTVEKKGRLRSACDGDAKPGCVAWAEMVFPNGSDAEKKSALSYFESACTERWTCAPLARVFQNGTAGVRDRDRANGLVEAACAWGDAESCRLGAQWAAQTDSREGKTHERRVQFWERACAAGSPDGCHELGVYRYYRDKPETHLGAARAAFEAACALGHSRACVDLAELLRRAEEGHAEAVALELHQWACAHQDPVGCRGAASLLSATDRGAARAALEHGCALDDGMACCRLSLVYLLADTVSWSPGKFLRYFFRAQTRSAGLFCGLLK